MPLRTGRFPICQNPASWPLLALCLSIASGTNGETLYANEAGRLPVGARLSALGDAAVALPVDVASAYWNPAASSLLPRREICLEGAMLYGGISNQAFFGAHLPLDQQIGVSLGYAPFFSGDIPRFDTLGDERSTGASSGAFQNNQHVCVLSIGKAFTIPLPRTADAGSLPLPLEIGAGCGFKGFWQTMNPGTTLRLGMNINCDLGLIVRLSLDYDLARKAVSRQLALGVGVRDILPTRFVWVNSPFDYEEEVHNTQYFGLSFIDRSGKLWANWLITASVHRTFREPDGEPGDSTRARYVQSFHGGIEAELWNIVSLRAGIADGVPTAGAGFHYRVFYLDYALRFDRIDFSPARLALGIVF